MTAKNPLQNKANATIRHLKAQNLLTDEHALTIQIIKSLCESWDEATSVTQKAAVSKELRYALAMLPKTDANASDEAADFLASLSDDG